MSRVLVIGWDGAEPTLVRDYIAQGWLPHLARLIQGGMFSEIASTVRPESAVAWASILTAAPPAAHGIFGFAYHVSGTYRTRLHTTAGVHLPFLWERLSAVGRPSVVINPPMAYPPRPFNGVLVCGQMTPSSDVVFTHPPALSHHLRRSGYPLDAEPPAEHEDRAAYLDRIEAQVARRTDAALDLLAAHPWEFALVVYTEPDRVQHFFWADMMADHPLRSRCDVTSRTAEGIPRLYRALDVALGRLWEATRPDLLVVVSDHGFGPCSRKVNMNAWLREQGWLALRSLARTAQVPGVLHRLRNWEPARVLKRTLFGRRPMLGEMHEAAFEAAVDWSRTSAWYSAAGGLRINLAGREPRGLIAPGRDYHRLRERLIAAALDLRDPLTGLPVFAAAWPREQLYPDSPFLEAAPDVILETFHPVDHALQNHIPLSGHTAPAQAIFADALPYTATHTDRALCATNVQPNLPVADLPGLGRWLMQLYGLQPGVQDSGQSGDLSGLGEQDDDALLRARLRALGYLE
ncbi:alkaline phosphatase family protein [Candidatus Roseilinea sp. NK_OTU-006]|uniref:alkaline phosphatase family protein n=1 Tax=Candidatus Roseilinea sp. NK_OTU-006 TaxID=2704250 RepID=UPI00145D45F5|nr:alkaline phosphatase family protein [Candidatus Roseilinea sp. NK_OTU-006]